MQDPRLFRRPSLQHLKRPAKSKWCRFTPSLLHVSTHVSLPPPCGPTQSSETGKFGRSVGTTYQGKGKGSREGKIGQGGRGRTQGGERVMSTTASGGKGSKGRAVSSDRPIGAASCRPKHTMASCQPPRAPQGPNGLMTRSARKCGTAQLKNQVGDITAYRPISCQNR